MKTDLHNLSHAALLANRRNIAAAKLYIRRQATWRNGTMDSGSVRKCTELNRRFDAINDELGYRASIEYRGSRCQP